MNKIKSWKYYQLLRNIFKFEIFYKLVVLFLLSPFIRKIMDFYLNKISYGILFNQNMFFDFLSWHGLLIILLIFGLGTLIAYYELYVIIQIIAMDYRNVQLPLRTIMLKSFRNMKHIHFLTLGLCGIYMILLLPLVHIGYLNSYIFRWDIPHFIFSELKLTMLGNVLICFIYVIYYSLYIVMIFTPIYITLKSQNICLASRSSISLLKKIHIKEKIVLVVMMLTWIICEYIIWKVVPYSLLHNRDFNFYFLKYVINSTSFRLSFLQYLAIIFISIIAMCFFIRYLVMLVYRYDDELVTIDQLDIPTDQLNKKIVSIQIYIKETIKSLKNDFLKSTFYHKHQKVIKIISIIVVFCLIFSYLQQSPAIHRPWVIGHRGSGYQVENTYEAIKDAADSEADYAEIDIHLSKDGVPIVFHDNTLSRLSDKNDNVSDLTFSELKEIELKQNGKSGHIISLEELIQNMKEDNLNIGLLVELKPTQGNGEEMATKVIEVIEDENFYHQSIFMSLDYPTVQIIKQSRPDWWVGYCIYGSVGDIDSSIWNMNIDFLAVEENRASNAFIQMAVNHMLPIYIWTVDNTKSMKQYLNMGVSGLITNYPDLGKAVTNEYESAKAHYYYYSGKGYPR